MGEEEVLLEAWGWPCLPRPPRQAGARSSSFLCVFGVRVVGGLGLCCVCGVGLCVVERLHLWIEMAEVGSEEVQDALGGRKDPTWTLEREPGYADDRPTFMCLWGTGIGCGLNALVPVPPKVRPQGLGKQNLPAGGTMKVANERQAHEKLGT